MWEEIWCLVKWWIKQGLTNWIDFLSEITYNERERMLITLLIINSKTVRVFMYYSYTFTILHYLLEQSHKYLIFFLT